MDNVCRWDYPCNKWNCKPCSQKKLYWLREKCVNFSRLLAFQTTYLSTLKGFKTAEIAHVAANAYVAGIKRQKSPYTKKFEYFYVIAKHNHSEFHVHIITNRYHPFFTAYHEEVKNRKAVCLYFVDNLEWSIDQDYGNVRRYSASSLLNKQSMKSWYKVRLCLWRIKTRLLIVGVLVNALVTMAYSATVTDKRVSNGRIPMSITPRIPDHRSDVARPPPKKTNVCVNNRFTFAITLRSEGG